MLRRNLTLTSINLNELKEFQKQFKSDWPKYSTEFYCIDNFINFLECDPQLENLEIFTNGKNTEGLFVVVDRYQLFLGGLDNCNSEFLEATLRELNWSKGLLCSSIPGRYFDLLTKVMKTKNLEFEYDDPTNLYYMPASQALQLKFETPNGYYLETLTEADGQFIDDLWPNHHNGSLYFIQRQIKMCLSVGLYEKNTNMLVAWCLRLQGGFMGALQVRDSYRRRGFGSIITMAMAQRLAATMGHDATALVNPMNRASCGMFDKLGFKIIDKCYWIHTKLKSNDFQWPEGQ